MNLSFGYVASVSIHSNSTRSSSLSPIPSRLPHLWFSPATIAADSLNLYSRKLQPPFRRVLAGKHHVEQGCVGQTAHRPDALYHPLKRKVLMFLRQQHLPLDPLQQFPNRL